MNDLNALKTQLDEKDQQIKDLKAELEQLHSKNSVTEDEVQSLNKVLKDTKNRLRHFEIDFNDANDFNNSLKAYNLELKDQIR